MRIYTKAGDLAFKTFTFPDGQPHFRLETYEREFNEVTVETALKSPCDLFTLLLAAGVLRSNGYASINLDIRYLLGARMDRAIGPLEPFTLDTVARLINGAGFTRVRILDAHSEVTTRLIRNSVNVLPKAVVDQVLTTLGDVDVVIPDKGATLRVMELAGTRSWVHQCYKTRDPQTGALNSFQVPGEGLKGRDLLIIDDICDGGGTFVGLAKLLKKAEAKSVNLFVTHGIFSKGLEALEGIDKIFTTDSYSQYATGRTFQRTVVIPISMKEM
jgi:ribose-phosphate pyrophosphokinase